MLFLTNSTTQLYTVAVKAISQERIHIGKGPWSLDLESPRHSKVQHGLGKGCRLGSSWRFNRDTSVNNQLEDLKTHPASGCGKVMVHLRDEEEGDITAHAPLLFTATVTYRGTAAFPDDVGTMPRAHVHTVAL